MKILFPVTKKLDNPFVNVIGRALQQRGHVVVLSVEEFWNPTTKYDIVHFQWPEVLVYWEETRITPSKMEELRDRIDFFRATGTLLAVTKHNDSSHYCTSEIVGKWSNLVYDSCKIVFHLDEWSCLRDCRNGNDGRQMHWVSPHPIYSDVDRTLSRDDARAMLGLSANKKMVLAFGAFRDDEERRLVLQARKSLRNVKVVAPRVFAIRRPLTIRSILSEAFRRIKFIRYGLCLSIGRFVKDDMLPIYFAATDVVLVQRLKILNSGNVPMGYYFGKVVVGPGVGNVGAILKRTGNPTFNVGRPDSVVEALRKGLVLSDSGLGAHNQVFADSNWTPELVAKAIEDGYNACLQKYSFQCLAKA